MSELLAKVMKEKRFIEQEKKEMKNYYIEVNYTHSGLCTMERDMLDQAKPFNNCIITEAQVDDLVAYFESLQQAFHKARPRLKTVDISHWPASNGVQYILIGQICLTLKEVHDTPDTFINFLIRRID